MTRKKSVHVQYRRSQHYRRPDDNYTLSSAAELSFSYFQSAAGRLLGCGGRLRLNTSEQVRGERMALRASFRSLLPPVGSMAVAPGSLWGNGRP